APAIAGSAPTTRMASSLRSIFSNAARLWEEPAIINSWAITAEEALCTAELLRGPLTELDGDLASLAATYERYGNGFSHAQSSEPNLYVIAILDGFATQSGQDVTQQNACFARRTFRLHMHNQSA